VRYLLECLLDGGADVNGVTTHGTSPLMFASLYSRNVELIRILVSRGGNPNYGQPNGVTVLMHGAMGGCADVVNVLLELGADARAVDDQGRTAGFFAKDRRFPDIARILTAADG